MDGCGSSGGMCAVTVDIQISDGAHHGIYKDKGKQIEIKYGVII